MKHFSTSDHNVNLADILVTAQSEPVILRQESEDVAVVLSMKEYEDYRRSKVADFQAFCDEVGKKAESRGLTEEKLSDILSEDE